MVSRIVLWMKARGMQPLVRRSKQENRSVNGVKLKNRGGRFRNTSESVFRKAAFGIGMSILHDGYKGSQVISRSYRQLEKTIDADVFSAFNKMIDEEFAKVKIK